ncbi:DUF3159 domain-containing protein [Catenulispora pinisilvae]|uniref:DUF3159 domain-containing protein n=1 Tax=Catenulispora pinisilvae TaxID=2705253 RepID=UPI0018927B33|nr:DUF3159 domain-containing protein [Catenulispora pinisilvae]
MSPTSPTSQRPEPAGADLWSALRERIGWRPIVDGSAPVAAFIAGFLAAGTGAGVAAAVGVAAMLCGFRVLRREGPRPALVALAVLLIAATVVHRTGRGVNLFLPDLIGNFALTTWFAVSLAAHRPATATLLRALGVPVDDLRAVPGLLRGHVQATSVWLVLWAVHLSIEVPLYLANDTLALAVVRVVLGPPMWLPVGWLGWRLIRRAVAEAAVAAPIKPAEPTPSA